MSDQPNVLFIVLDTLRRDRLSAYGHLGETSPIFDALVPEATLFERAVAPAQWTIPAHGSMFTGLYPSVHQLTQANGVLPDGLPTLAEILQVAGYHTVAFCNNPLVGVLDNGLQRGFDHFYNYAGVSPNRPVDSRRNALRRALISRFRLLARRVSNLFARYDALFRWSLNPLWFPFLSNLVNYKGHTARSIDDLIAYWQGHDRDQQPIFAFLNLMGAHLPYRPPREWLSRIAPDVSRDRHAYPFMARFNADAARWPSPLTEPLTDWQYRTLDAFYSAEIAYQDAQLRRLFDYLRASGQMDNTLLIVAADHGEGHGEHDFFGHGFVVYQELVHVPLLIAYPERFAQGQRVSTNVSTRRIFHTILNITGARTPFAEGDPNADISGLSLVSATNGHPDSEGNIAYAEAYPPLTFLNVLRHRHPELIPQKRLTDIRRGVYAGSHKLVQVGESIEGLFQPADDPTETRNLADAQPETVQSLQAHLARFVAETDHQRRDSALSLNLSEAMRDNLRALGYFE